LREVIIEPRGDADGVLCRIVKACRCGTGKETEGTMRMRREHFEKLGIGIAVVFLFGISVWLGYRLFTHSLGIDPIIGVAIFIACVAGWILLIRLAESRRYRWVRPSLKLTTFCVVAVVLVLSFAGVQPLSDYKDRVISEISARLGMSGIPVFESPPIPYGVYCDLLETACIALKKDQIYATNIFGGFGLEVEAGTYSVSGDFITFTNEATRQVHVVKYMYSKSTGYLYLYLSEWSSEPTAFFVHQ